jgi:hypothetical protein
MRNAVMAAAAAVASLWLVAGCGGGGGSGGSKTTSVAIASQAVNVTAAYGDPAPTHPIRITATNPPKEGLYMELRGSPDALSSAYFNSISDHVVDAVLQFRPPVELPVGTVNSSVTIRVCYDQACTLEVRGSPASVAVNYTVTNQSTVALATSSVSVTRDMADTSLPATTATVNVSSPPGGALYLMLDHSTTYVQSVSNLSGAGRVVNLQLTFRQAAIAGVGVHTEDVQIRACYDSGCTREVPGSPLIIHATYTVTHNEPTEGGFTPLPYLSRTALSHDVVDAEYDHSREAIVMVSASPTSALYIYDVSNGTERQLALVKAPTAVSISPDGRFAAVGHDALITYVDLQSVVDGAPTTKLLDVSTNVLDLVLDGRGNVHALPLHDQWQDVHSVAVATNTETLGTGLLFAGTLGRLHPAGDFMYTADNGLSPSDIAKWDLRSGVATSMYDSPYHGDYPMCGNLWFKEDGTTIYTKCGNTFRSSATKSQDMVYSGRLTLSSQLYGYQIQALSEADATKEIMLVEGDSFECGPYTPGSPCYMHLALYESEFLNRTAVYSLPPIQVGGGTYSQRGTFVFHSNNGLHRYLISWLAGAPGATTPTYLTTIQ